MRVIGWFLPALLLVSACASETDEAQQPQEQAEQAETPASEQEAVPSLAGSWSVASIEGADLTQYYDMNATVTDDRFTIESECVRIAFDYRQDRNIVSFDPVQAAGCERMRTHNEDQIGPIIDQANIAIFSDGGDTVELTGPGGRVTLTRR